MKDTTHLLESLVEESQNSVLSIKMEEVGDSLEAEQIQRLWQEKCPALCFDIEIKGGVWFLLISKKNQLRVVVRYDN